MCLWELEAVMEKRAELSCCAQNFGRCEWGVVEAVDAGGKERAATGGVTPAFGRAGP